MRLRCLLFCLMGVLLTGAAKADLVLTLDQPQVVALPGDMLTFTGNLTNTNGFETFLNGAGFSQIDTGLTGDETPFFSNTPLSLMPGESLPSAVTLFTVTLDNGLQAGQYSGTFQVLGGPDAMTFNPLTTADFQITIAPVAAPPSVPEPGSVAFALSLAGAGGVLARHRRRR